MIARDGSTGLATVRTVTSQGLAVATECQSHAVAGSTPADLPAELCGRSDGDAVDGDDHVVDVEDPRGGNVGRDARDEHPSRRCHDVVAERAQRDDGRDLLRALHVGCVLPIALRVRLARRSEHLLGDERRAVRPREREELLEQAHSAHEEVDVVDVALLAGPASFDLDLVGERLRPVRHEEEVVRGEPPEELVR